MVTTRQSTAHVVIKNLSYSFDNSRTSVKDELEILLYELCYFSMHIIVGLLLTIVSTDFMLTILGKKEMKIIKIILFESKQNQTYYKYCFSLKLYKKLFMIRNSGLIKMFIDIKEYYLMSAI